jgi:hypothetical protein
MDKINKIKSILPLLSDNQLDILDRIISSWDIKSSQLHTDDAVVKAIYESTINPIEDPLKNYSKEELLEEYGVLFYNQNEMGQTNSNMEGIEIEYPQNMTNKNSKENKYDNLDIKLLISKKPLIEETVKQQTSDEDFDPLFPDVDFDSMTGLNKSKYDDMDFSALISKKPK